MPLPRLELFVVPRGGTQNANELCERMWAMNPTYYTVTRFLWSVALKCEVWFRLTYERTYIPERALYRDKLVHSEIVS